MKNSPLAGILLGVLTVSVLLSAVLFWTYVSGARRLRDMQPTVIGFQNQKNVFSALISEVAEYSKTHKDMEPILEAAGFTNRPAAK